MVSRTESSSRQRGPISLAVPKAAEGAIALYNVLGRRVAVLAEGRLEARAHELALDASVLPAGVYLVRAQLADGRSFARSLTLTR